MDIWTIIDRLLDAPTCRLCHARCLPGPAVCADCSVTLPHLGRACPRCALPLPGELEETTLCGECLAHPPPFDRSIAAFRYAEPINELISRFKYHHALADGRLLAELLGQTLIQHPDAPVVDRVVPLPLHPRRLRERGFNQAAELALWLARAQHLELDSGLLVRRHQLAHQRQAPRRQRQRNVRDAFVCTQSVQGQRIALVDDVLTTGATARAAAAALKRAGASWVEVWAVARTPRPGMR